MTKRGRRKGSDGEQSRALLLSIATEEFAEYGYYETKISNIVKKAGVSQPTFYLYFKSKDAIFQELVNLFRFELKSLTQRVRMEPGNEELSVADQMAGGLEGIFTFFKQNKELTRIGFYVSVESVEIKALMADQIEANLKFEVQKGYFRDDIDMKIVAESLIGAIERLTFYQLFQGRKEPEELAQEIVNILVNGMAKTEHLSHSYSL